MAIWSVFPSLRTDNERQAVLELEPREYRNMSEVVHAASQLRPSCSASRVPRKTDLAVVAAHRSPTSL